MIKNIIIKLIKNIGLHTGMRNNGFALTLNARTNASLKQNLYDLIYNKNSHNICYLMRKTIENVNSY